MNTTQKNKYRAILTGAIFCLQGSLLATRSIHRPIDYGLPSIKVRWLEDTHYEQLRSPHLENDALFRTYDPAHFQKNQLPAGTISFRANPEKTVATQLLSELIEQLLTEVRKHKKRYTHFITLQDKNFNRKRAYGFLVVKFKKFPFVVKLFIETPRSFVHPDSKGFEPIFFFYMGGGINRHLLGFTRIKNLAHINKKLKENKNWASLIKTPRKWFWLPKNPTWIDIEGENLGDSGHAHAIIPGTYAIVADAITSNQTFSIKNAKHRKKALKLCNYLDLYVDPHIDNFMIEEGTGKIAIIDTEHFPSLVGFKEKRFISSYFDWYMKLMYKCAENLLFCSKDSAKKVHRKKSELALPREQ